MQTKIENDVSYQRQQLDVWLSDVYSQCPEAPKNGELEAGYPNWGQVETLVGRIFDKQLVSQLSRVAVRSLLFFISRSDECGRIIAWLCPETGTPFSNIGKLSYDDFACLCAQALAEPDDFCDYQLVNCFQKLPDLSPDDEALLEAFFHSKTDSYTRRMVVHAFAKFRLGKTIPLIRQLWNTDNCEFAKLSCLYSLEPFPESRDLFSHYLKEYQDRFPVTEEKYRVTHVERLLAVEGK